jgi:hypothetical protein
LRFHCACLRSSATISATFSMALTFRVKWLLFDGGMLLVWGSPLLWLCPSNGPRLRRRRRAALRDPAGYDSDKLTTVCLKLSVRSAIRASGANSAHRRVITGSHSLAGRHLVLSEQHARARFRT